MMLDFLVTLLIIGAAITPLLAGPLILGSFVFTQGATRQGLRWWFALLVALCLVPAAAGVLGALVLL